MRPIRSPIRPIGRFNFQASCDKEFFLHSVDINDHGSDCIALKIIKIWATIRPKKS